MSPAVIGIIGIGALLLLMVLGMPIGFAMAFIGFVGYISLGGVSNALWVMGMEPFQSTSSYEFAVLPLFILMAHIASLSGISERLYETAYKWAGRLPGGLAMSTIVACAGFAAICGSSTATAVTMGKVAAPPMKRYNYDDALSTGSIAAGGTLGILIPPSALFIIYGMLTQQSIGKLFMAGIIPGVLLAFLYMLTIYFRVKRNPRLGGTPPPPLSMKEKLVALTGAIDTGALFLLVMGGLFVGLFSPNEAAGVGVAGSLVIGLARRKLSWRSFTKALVDSSWSTAMIFTIVIGAMIFNRFLCLTTLPTELANFAGGLDIPPMATAGVICLIYLVLGCFFDGVAITLLTVPIFYPVIVSIGLHPIWFGVMFCIVMEMGLITPPVGMNVFVLAGVVRDVPMYTIFRGVLPFLVPMWIIVGLLMAFPELALFLPTKMM